MQDLGLYIHIPYCKRKCTYCNFHFSTQIDTKNKLIQSLLSEIKQRANEINDGLVKSIYFGGGTPSVMSENELGQILNQIRKYYNIASEVEITLESNPDDLNSSYLKGLSYSEINRLSIGIQSFEDKELVWMNRAHDSAQSHHAIQASLEAGFNNISCDLIYGIPISSHEIWHNNISHLINYNIPHISCYALSVEEKTKLYSDIKLNKTLAPDDQFTIEQMQILFDRMDKNNYEAYELSSYCKNGYRSKHNSSYWQNKSYLGFGPSAHSFHNNRRRWNVANNNIYIQSINSLIPYFEEETLSHRDRYNEYVMLNLRRIEGIDLKLIQLEFNEYFNNCKSILQEYYKNKYLILEGNKYRLSNKGKIICDQIIRNLFEL
ncbi:MAG: radical SAM family heme chaperone HemW [Saprospiraceae bacterium]